MVPGGIDISFVFFMEDKDSMTKIFISYSHKDECFLNAALISMLEELKAESSVEYFYDRKLHADCELFETLEFHIKECDIAILLLSKNYYDSDACKKEKEMLLHRKLLEGIYLLPIVVSDCDWKKDDSIKNNLFLNTDAKAMSDLSADELKTELTAIKERIIAIVNDIKSIHDLTFKDTFADVLQDMDVLKTSHRSRNTLILKDVFVYPILRKFVFDDDNDYEINSEKLLEDSKDSKFIFILGDDLSGKTSLLRKYISNSKEKNFIPLYFSSEDNFDGHIFNILTKKFKVQFNTTLPSDDIKKLLENNTERILFFIDDFHKIQNKQKLVEKIKLFSKIICTADIIYSLDYEIKDIRTLAVKYSIKEFSPKQRNELIKKWLYLDNDIRTSDELTQIKEIDKKTNQIEIVTGKALNGGIMPAYPFLVLSVLSNIETLNRPLNQQMTSFGYCYEALIIIAFTKCGLKTDDQMGGTINFLSSFAYALHQKQVYEMSSIDFQSFLNDYEKRFALPLKKDDFIKKLKDSRLMIKTTLGNYRFDYKYIYYFFLAKHFSENLPDSLSEIKELCRNIHKDENAYIIIFFSHNSKSDAFYDVLLNEANSIYTTIKTVSLTKYDMQFFDDSYKTLIDIVLPNKLHNYKTERVKQLESKKEREYSPLPKEKQEDFNDEYLLNLRKSIKLTEAIGLIVKNRYTSIERPKVSQLLSSAINLNLRELNSFFDLFKDSKNQADIIGFLADAVKERKTKDKNIDDEKCSKIAHNFFWGMNFFYIFIIILKTIQSIGSENLVPFIKDITEQNPTPANQLILEGVKIIYAKNVDKNNLFRYIKDSNYSHVAKTILRMLVIEYCRTNPINHSELQQLSSKMQIPIKQLNKQ